MLLNTQNETAVVVWLPFHCSNTPQLPVYIVVCVPNKFHHKHYSKATLRKDLHSHTIYGICKSMIKQLVQKCKQNVKCEVPF